MFYLIKLNRTYHLRLKLPPDISHILSKHELKFSLKVSRKRLAIKKVSAIKHRVRDLFENSLNNDLLDMKVMKYNIWKLIVIVNGVDTGTH